MSRRPRLASWLFLGWATLVLVGCDNMEHQSSYRPYDPSIHFPNGSSARIPPAHTVPDGPLSSDAFLTGRRHGQWITDLPMPLTAEILQRGRERFTIDCAVCHGEDGYGRGIVVRRGFPAPPSFHDPALRALPSGQIYDVMTHGYGAMYPAADRVAPADRWAIVAYLRALQLSQHASLADVEPAARANLEAR